MRVVAEAGHRGRFDACLAGPVVPAMGARSQAVAAVVFWTLLLSACGPTSFPSSTASTSTRLTPPSAGPADPSVSPTPTPDPTPASPPTPTPRATQPQQSASLPQPTKKPFLIRVLDAGSGILTLQTDPPEKGATCTASALQGSSDVSSKDLKADKKTNENGKAQWTGELFVPAAKTQPTVMVQFHATCTHDGAKTSATSKPVSPG